MPNSISGSQSSPPPSPFSVTIKTEPCESEIDLKYIAISLDLEQASPSFDFESHSPELGFSSLRQQTDPAGQAPYFSPLSIEEQAEIVWIPIDDNKLRELISSNSPSPELQPQSASPPTKPKTFARKKHLQSETTQIPGPSHRGTRNTPPSCSTFDATVSHKPLEASSSRDHLRPRLQRKCKASLPPITTWAEKKDFVERLKKWLIDKKKTSAFQSGPEALMHEFCEMYPITMYGTETSPTKLYNWIKEAYNQEVRASQSKAQREKK